jgi:site-specific DNA recombinase
MINTLNKLGIEPQAIEQPLDLEIPENKIMLAFYLAAPEVENDRRALNVFAGMRRARHEGRWMASAPKGYKNTLSENGKKIIAPNEDAPIIKWAFEELLKNNSNSDDVRKAINTKGVKCCKNNFLYLIRNPVYCGKIQIPAYKDEEALEVNGLHEPIVSEALFYEVQDIINGRRPKFAFKVSAKEELPLRGYLLCPRCNKKLTGSASRGGSGIRHFYYHCTKGCPERIKANEVNEAYEGYLKTLIFDSEPDELYQQITKEFFKLGSENQGQSQKEIQAEILINKERINNAQQMMLDGKISPEDYKDAKGRYEPIITKLERKHLSSTKMEVEFRHHLKIALNRLKNLEKQYIDATLDCKQSLIGSICPEFYIFQENVVRTTKESQLLSLIAQLDGQDRAKKNQADCNFNSQPNWVLPPGLEPGTLRL